MPITRERDGVVKSPPTTHVKETDEFGLIVRTDTVKGALLVTVDRVDSLGGAEGEQEAKRRGQDYSNDHFEVNDSHRTRTYALASNVVIWKAFPSDERISVAQWLAYLQTDLGRQSMFHLDLEGGHVVIIEEQYYP
ncbi:MAG: hypothetical protein JWM40_903 [Frankiales bacterium]|nr:hypothetical protein [Frankiales bacterium]